MNIWNESNTDVEFNMTSLNKNVEEFITKFVQWMEQPPSADNRLMEWLTWDGIIEYLSNMYMDPNM